MQEQQNNKKFWCIKRMEVTKSQQQGHFHSFHLQHFIIVTDLLRNCCAFVRGPSMYYVNIWLVFEALKRT